MRAGPPIERCGAELLRTLLPEGKVRKSQVFRCFLRSLPATKRVVTAKPSRRTPRQRSTIAAARHTSPTIDALSSTGHRRLNPEAADHPHFYCLTRTVAAPNFVSLRHWRQSGRFLHPGSPPMRAGPPIERCGAELLRTLLPEGKARKSQVFRCFLRSLPATKRVVTAKPSRWTPRQRSTIAAARHTGRVRCLRRCPQYIHPYINNRSLAVCIVMIPGALSKILNCKCLYDVNFIA
jgi:hypothetical protein